MLFIHQFGSKTESKASSRHKTCHLHRCPNKREVREGAYVETDIQKLVNILIIYTLEHAGMSHTHGMTKLLTPTSFVFKATCMMLIGR